MGIVDYFMQGNLSADDFMEDRRALKPPRAQGMNPITGRWPTV